jgi:hypothetical protein
MLLTNELLRKAVDAYDAARCRIHGQTVEDAGMSETNKQSIAPMIAAAIRAVLAATDAPRYPEGMPEWAKLTPEELRGEDPRPSVQVQMEKLRAQTERQIAIHRCRNTR